VTLLSVGELSSEDRKTADGVAPGGRRAVWLIEPPEGSSNAPIFGEVRLRVGGATYNKVTNTLSSKPLAPSLIVHDYVKVSAEGHAWFVAARQSVQRNAVVAEVLIRGGELARGASGVAEIRVGLVDGSKTKFVWFSVPFGSGD
jgi:hypothetical protein